jgi:hypothetical protein
MSVVSITVHTVVSGEELSGGNSGSGGALWSVLIIVDSHVVVAWTGVVEIVAHVVGVC